MIEWTLVFQKSDFCSEVLTTLNKSLLAKYCNNFAYWYGPSYGFPRPYLNNKKNGPSLVGTQFINKLWYFVTKSGYLFKLMLTVTTWERRLSIANKRPSRPFFNSGDKMTGSLLAEMKMILHRDEYCFLAQKFIKFFVTCWSEDFGRHQRHQEDQQEKPSLHFWANKNIGGPDGFNLLSFINFIFWIVFSLLGLFFNVFNFNSFFFDPLLRISSEFHQKVHEETLRQILPFL